MRTPWAPLSALIFAVFACLPAAAVDSKTRQPFGGDKGTLGRWVVLSSQLELDRMADFHGLDLTDAGTRIALLEAADLNGLKVAVVLAEPSPERKLQLLFENAQSYARSVSRLATSDASWAAPLKRADRIGALAPADVRTRIEAVKKAWDKRFERPDAPAREPVDAAGGPSAIRKNALEPSAESDLEAPMGRSLLDKLPWATAGLAAANIGVYSAQHSWFNPERWGFHVHTFADAVKNHDALGIGAAAVTAVTSLFLHNFDLHLWMNIGGLLVYGMTLEFMLGRRRFLTLYLAGGLAAVAALPALYWGEAIRYAGASPAVSAVFGAFIPVLIARRHALPDALVGWATLLSALIPFYFFGNIAGWLTMGAAEIGFETHVIGFVVGLALASIFLWRERAKESW